MRISKSIILVAVAVSAVLGVSAASAANLPARTYTKALNIAPVYNWTGFYVGVNAGGAWGPSDPTTTTVFSPAGYFALSSVGAIATAGAQRADTSVSPAV
jgi:outer membrane immunogenic protein